MVLLEAILRDTDFGFGNAKSKKDGFTRMEIKSSFVDVENMAFENFKFKK
jgi:hypothetical protein